MKIAENVKGWLPESARMSLSQEMSLSHMEEFPLFLPTEIGISYTFKVFNVKLSFGWHSTFEDFIATGRED